AEDGIRDFHVTGVQTCALPISRDSGRDLTPQQRDLMRTIMGQAFGDRAGGWQQGGGSGGGFAGGGRSGGFPGEPSGRVTESADAGTYQFGGEYWVVALRNNRPVPVKVTTGLTDLEYSEVVSGLEPGDRVLLLPSTSLYEQQE